MANGWLRSASTRAIGDAAAPAALVLGVYYAGLAPLHWLRMPAPHRTSVAVLAALSSLAFLGLAAYWRWLRRPADTGGVVAMLAAIVLVNNTNVIARMPIPDYSTGFYLILPAFGIVDLSWRTFWLLCAAVFGAFAPGPLSNGFAREWVEPTILLAASGVLALVLRIYRVRSNEKIDAARAESDRQRLAAERNLAALEQEVLRRERLQERLARAERLESLALLAGGVAHDFNNLMAVVIGNASLASRRAGGGELRADLDAILEAGDRATLLARELLAYAGRSARRVEPLDLGQEVTSIAGLAQSSLPAGVSLRVDRLELGIFVTADRAQLQQVVLNLIVNAADASAAEGGVVGVSVGLAELDAEAASTLDPAADRVAGSYAFLRVTDRGIGMSEDTLKHIFDPFFTTKQGGRGLGLAAALGIAKAHGGGFRVASALGSGSEFVLLLPCSAERPATRPERLVAAARAERHAILVVDDEAAVRRTIARTLTAHGYEVIEAGGGLEAEERLRADPAAPRAAVVDMSMPEVDGEATLARLRAIRPDLPILLSSGFDVHATAERLADLPGVDFLAKPYRSEQLVACLTRLIDGAGAVEPEP